MQPEMGSQLEQVLLAALREVVRETLRDERGTVALHKRAAA